MAHTATKLIESLHGADQVMRALRVFGEGKADFADCTQNITFEVGTSKHAGMTLIGGTGSGLNSIRYRGGGDE